MRRGPPYLVSNTHGGAYLRFIASSLALVQFTWYVDSVDTVPADETSRRLLSAFDESDHMAPISYKSMHALHFMYAVPPLEMRHSLTHPLTSTLIT